MYKWGDTLTEYEFSYTGIVIALVMTQVTAGFLIVKVIDATMSTSRGFFYLYGHGSNSGDYISFYELIAVFTYITAAGVISLMGFIMAGI